MDRDFFFPQSGFCRQLSIPVGCPQQAFQACLATQEAQDSWGVLGKKKTCFQNLLLNWHAKIYNSLLWGSWLKSWSFHFQVVQRFGCSFWLVSTLIERPGNNEQNTPVLHQPPRQPSSWPPAPITAFWPLLTSEFLVVLLCECFYWTTCSNIIQSSTLNRYFCKQLGVGIFELFFRKKQISRTNLTDESN